MHGEVMLVFTSQVGAQSILLKMIPCALFQMFLTPGIAILNGNDVVRIERWTVQIKQRDYSDYVALVPGFREVLASLPWRMAIKVRPTAEPNSLNPNASAFRELKAEPLINEMGYGYFLSLAFDEEYEFQSTGSGSAFFPGICSSSFDR
jgi:hypothetical protein